MEFKGDVIAYGYSLTNSELITVVKLTTNSTEFYVNDMFFKVPLLGRHHAKNATFVIAVARLLNVNDEKIKRGKNQINLTNMRSEEHTSELQSRGHLVCRLLLEKQNK